MTIPITLAQPPEVAQDPKTCWAAAYISWAAADSNLHDAPRAHRVEAIEDLLVEFDEWGMTQNDRLTMHGLRLLASRGLMNLRRYNAGNLTVERVASLIEEYGYLYLAVYEHGKTGHALVVYGASSENIMVMDPTPGIHFKTIPASFFVQNRTVRVYIGVSLLGVLARSLDRVVDRVRW